MAPRPIAFDEASPPSEKLFQSKTICFRLFPYSAVHFFGHDFGIELCSRCSFCSCVSRLAFFNFFNNSFRDQPSWMDWVDMPTGHCSSKRKKYRPGPSWRLMSYCYLAMSISVFLSGIEQLSIDKWHSRADGRWNTLTQPCQGQEYRPDGLDNALPASYGGISAAVA